MATASRLRHVAIALIGVVGTSVGALPLVAGTATAGGTFELGSGKVRANLFEVVPRTGGLTIPYSGGKSSAAYQGHRAEATATVGKPFLPIEPKVITDILEGKPPKSPVGGVGPPSEAMSRQVKSHEQAAPPLAPSARPADCGDNAPGGGGGGDPSAPPTASPFTFNLSVNSDEENSDAGKYAVFAASPADSPVQGAVAEQQVFATGVPDGHAIATQGRMGVAGTFEMIGGRSETRAGIVDGNARRSEGSVTIERLTLLDGVVVMENLRWDALQRTGEGEAKQSRFSMGSASIAGTPYPLPDSGDGGAAFFAALNQALAPTGLVIDPPQVADDDDDARVTPMSLRLSDSPLGRAAVGPVVGAAQPVRDPLVDGLLGFSCDFGLFVTVADVAISVASGSGGLAFNFGGITATTDGTTFDNPFADGFGPGLDSGFGDVPDDSGFGDAPDSEYPEPAGFPTVEDAFSADPGTFAGAAFPVTGTPFPVRPTHGPIFGAPLGPLPEDLPSVPTAGEEELAAPGFDQPIPLGSSERREDGSRGGTALAAGLIGLIVIAALIVADAIHIRRVAGSAA